MRDNLNRRSFLKGMGGTLAAPPAAPAATPPNVLFIISDQFHHASYGAAGNPVVKTPHLDRLAGEGVRFEHALCATPFCSPTRASFLTGLYAHKHGITHNVDGNKAGLNPNLPSTEQVLFENGYACRQFGKWHLGERSTLPAYAGQAEEAYREKGPGRKSGPEVGRSGLEIHMTEAVRQANAKWDGNGASNTRIGRIERAPEMSPESRITDEAIRELDRLAGKPFLLTVSLPAPHAPWEVGEPYYSMHKRASIALPANRNSVEPVDRTTAAWRFGQLLGEDGMREYLGVYYGLISMVDWNIGRLLDALKNRSLERDTLVIFTADHGDMHGGHGMYDKQTYSMYEETTRVPLILRWPGKIAAGKTVRTQAGSCDLHPTILDYLSLKPRGTVHGASLRNYIEGREDESRPMFCERERGRDGFQRLIRTLDWKYAYNSNGASQLYHLAKDPGETRNLLKDPSAGPVRLKLHGQLAEWMRQTEDGRSLAG